MRVGYETRLANCVPAPLRTLSVDAVILPVHLTSLLSPPEVDVEVVDEENVDEVLGIDDSETENAETEDTETENDDKTTESAE